MVCCGVYGEALSITNVWCYGYFYTMMVRLMVWYGALVFPVPTLIRKLWFIS